MNRLAWLLAASVISVHVGLLYLHVPDLEDRNWTHLATTTTGAENLNAYGLIYHPLCRPYVDILHVLFKFGDMAPYAFMTLCGLISYLLLMRIARNSWSKSALSLLWLSAGFRHQLHELRPDVLILLIVVLNVSWVIEEWPGWVGYIVGTLAGVGCWIYPSGYFLIVPMMIVIFMRFSSRSIVKDFLTWFGCGLIGTMAAIDLTPWTQLRVWCNANIAKFGMAQYQGPAILKHPFNPGYWLYRGCDLLTKFGPLDCWYFSSLFWAICVGIVIRYWISYLPPFRIFPLVAFTSLYSVAYVMLSGTDDWRYHILVYPFILMSAVEIVVSYFGKEIIP